MKTLYILNNPAQLEQCQSVMTEADGLLLIENAVVLANQQTVNSHCYVLEEDLIARGLTTKSGWAQKDYQGFVELTLTFDKTVSWL